MKRLKHYLPIIATMMLMSAKADAQTIILTSGPADAYTAALSSTLPTSTGVSPGDIYAAAWTAGGTAGGWRTFFKFSDTALTGLTIDSAILQLHADPSSVLGYTGSPTFGIDNACALYRVTTPWINTSVTWVTMPGYTSTDSVILPQSTSTVENYLHINVTNLLNDIVHSGVNYGFMLKSIQETTPYNSMIFSSSSATDSVVRPRIIVYVHSGNSAPHFTDGPVQSITTCVNETTTAIPVNTVLSVMDVDAGQTETWTIATAPAHGTAMVTYITTATGGVLLPSGLTYTPTGAYTGTDVFKVRVTDGIASDTITINMIINPYPNAGIITGTDTVCPGQSTYLSETVSGGIWSTSSFTISDIGSGGMASGLVPGTDTVIYTISNSCGIVSALFPFRVRSYAECHTGTSLFPVKGDELVIYPDPVYNELNISATGKIKTVAITNMPGQVVYMHEYNATQVQINVADLPAGVYFIKVNGANVRKFVKQ